eukprot:TRINITY_DN1884_c0_g1_i1.p1 TRINITY_DN1884_c0_g1~~TRINITY_DN1884_c0_g1_i1.p1  ORF type:complete len:1013 (-),score=148.81 TRINITY_DN1884_c0_g1_i1:71-3109(-)
MAGGNCAGSSCVLLDSVWLHPSHFDSSASSGLMPTSAESAWSALLTFKNQEFGKCSSLTGHEVAKDDSEISKKVESHRIAVSGSSLTFSEVAVGCSITKIQVPLVFSEVGYGFDPSLCCPVIVITNSFSSKPLNTWSLIVGKGEDSARHLITVIGSRGAIRHQLRTFFEINKTPLGSVKDSHTFKATQIVPGSAKTSVSTEPADTTTEFAAKIIKSSEAGSTNTEEQALARKEVSMLVSGQSHPNIERFYGVFHHQKEQDQLSYWGILTEYYPRGDLFDAISKQVLKEPMAKDMALGLLGALDHLHNNGIVHRDVKPESVLLAVCGRPILSHFNMAARSTDRNEMIRRCGTPGYVAPEVLVGPESQCGAKMDIFSLGVLLHYCLSRLLPFRGRTLACVCKKTIRCRVDFCNGFDEVSDSCKIFLRQLLTKQPESRYTASQALKSNWISGCDDSAEEQASRRPLLPQECSDSKSLQDKDAKRVMSSTYTTTVEQLENPGSAKRFSDQSESSSSVGFSTSNAFFDDDMSDHVNSCESFECSGASDRNKGRSVTKSLGIVEDSYFFDRGRNRSSSCSGQNGSHPNKLTEATNRGLAKCSPGNDSVDRCRNEHDVGLTSRNGQHKDLFTEGSWSMDDEDDCTSVSIPPTERFTEDTLSSMFGEQRCTMEDQDHEDTENRLTIQTVEPSWSEAFGERVSLGSEVQPNQDVMYRDSFEDDEGRITGFSERITCDSYSARVGLPRQSRCQGTPRPKTDEVGDGGRSGSGRSVTVQGMVGRFVIKPPSGPRPSERGQPRNIPRAPQRPASSSSAMDGDYCKLTTTRDGATSFAEEKKKKKKKKDALEFSSTDSACVSTSGSSTMTASGDTYSMEADIINRKCFQATVDAFPRGERVFEEGCGGQTRRKPSMMTHGNEESAAMGLKIQDLRAELTHKRSLLAQMEVLHQSAQREKESLEVARLAKFFGQPSGQVGQSITRQTDDRQSWDSLAISAAARKKDELYDRFLSTRASSKGPEKKR